MDEIANEPDLADLVRRLRGSGLEPLNVEVKSAAGGFPRSVPEMLSSFANGSGGTLILGLAEEDGFRPAPGFDAGRIREALAQACHDKMTPPLRAPIEVLEFEGAQVIRLEVDELDSLEKPCFITTRGEYYGSFIRAGDGDRRLSHYEVSQLLSNRSQPMFDNEMVAQATVDDLDPKLVEATLAHAAQRAPRTFGSGIDREAALKRLGAVRDVDGTVRPTLAGLLSLGTYPQQFFPQLFVSVVVLPRTRMGELGPEGERFLDNVTIDGPIPEMVSEAMIALRRNMNTAAIVHGLGREDRYDYPLEAVRELVVNAIMHRDYSPASRGIQVHIELYPDRLLVRSPGGLYGDIAVDALGTTPIMSTSRNATMAKLLTDVALSDRPTETIVENRGSGLLRVVEALRKAGMSPPEFETPPGHVQVTIPRTALLSTDTVTWIGSLGLPALSNDQHLALAMMRNTGRATTAMLRAWGVDPAAAGRALRQLVDLGVAARTGGKRYAAHYLTDSSQAPGHDSKMPGSGIDPARTASAYPGIEAELDAVVQAIRAGHVTTRAISEHLDIGYQTVLRRIKVLTTRGVVTPTQPSRSRKQSYRLIEPEEQ